MFFFWEISPKHGWVGAQFPQKKSQILDEQKFTLCVPKSHKNPGVGGCLNTFGKDLPKKYVFFTPSLNHHALVCVCFMCVV